MDRRTRERELSYKNATLPDGKLILLQSSDVLTHGDVFRQHVMPQMMDGKADWDNLSDEDGVGVSDMDGCRARCEAQLDCKQYSFMEKTKQCKTRVDPRLGKQSVGTQSAWLKDRILDFSRNMPACAQEGWQVGPRTRHTKCKL